MNIFVMDINAIVNALFQYIPILALAMFLLVSAVQIIVEVIKGMLPNLPTAILVFIVSIVVTVLALFIAASIMEIIVRWYFYVCAGFLGIFVAHAAMNGWERYKEIFDRIRGISGKK